MIERNVFVREINSYIMNCKSSFWTVSTREVFCELALLLARGWKLRSYRKFLPGKKSVLEIAIKDATHEHRISFKSEDADFESFYRMALHAQQAESPEARLAVIKRDLLRGCGIEESYEELRAELSVHDLAAAITYAYRSDEFLDFAEAHTKCQAERWKYKDE